MICSILSMNSTRDGDRQEYALVKFNDAIHALCSKDESVRVCG